MKILTIGVYGFDESTFRSALLESNAEVLVDIRQRRGVRGAQYAFANSRRLQGILKEMGITYVHAIQYAPRVDAIRSEHEAARAANIPQRSRNALSDGFVDSYQRNVLKNLDARDFVSALPAGTGSFALFCVERVPEACHRSLLAERLATDLNAIVEHIVPPAQRQLS